MYQKTDGMLRVVTKISQARACTNCGYVEMYLYRRVEAEALVKFRTDVHSIQSRTSNPAGSFQTTTFLPLLHSALFIHTGWRVCGRSPDCLRGY
jgi:hypothetical protein